MISVYLLLDWGNEIASITSQNVVFDFTLSTFSKRYHFPNAGKMIFYHFACVDTSVFSSLDDSFKSFPFGITQYLCKFSCTPTFYAFVFVGNSFKLLEQFFDFFFLHNCLFFMIFRQSYAFYLVAARKSLVIFHFLLLEGYCLSF